MRAADEDDVREPVHAEIVEEVSGAAKERRVLATPEGATDVAHVVSTGAGPGTMA
jgi:hypothetical protein